MAVLLSPSFQEPAPYPKPTAFVWLLFSEKQLAPIIVSCELLWTPPALYPITVLSSPVEIVFPAFQPSITLFVELDVSDPAALFECVFLGTLLSAVKPPPNEDPSAFAKLAAVTIPLKTAPPSEKLTPIPGNLRWLILLLPNVISLDTAVALGNAL